MLLITDIPEPVSLGITNNIERWTVVVRFLRTVLGTSVTRYWWCY
jgi:hypothetical protein